MASRFDILVSSDSDDDEAHKLSPEAQTEIESLGFIYGEDLSVRGRDLTFKIRLDHEGGPLVWDLEITLDGSYPTTKPTVRAKGTVPRPEELDKRLQQKMGSLNAGDGMLFDLVVTATEFLSEHAGLAAAAELPLNERMEVRVRLEEEAERREQEERREREQASAAAAEQHEALKLDEAFEKEKRRREEANARGLREQGDTARLLRASSSVPHEEHEDQSSDSDDLMALAEIGGTSGMNSFRVLGVLGKGGGGEVFRARNRLDRLTYAVKKIRLDRKEYRKILREIKTLSRLSHYGVVRYYQAWVEFDNTEGPRGAGGEAAMDSNGLLDSDSDSESENGAGEGLWHVSPFQGRRRRSSSLGTETDNESEAQDEWEDMDSMSEGSGIDLHNPDPLGADDPAVSPPGAAESAPLPPCHLYIQMEFCSKTLRAAIDEGLLWQNPDECWRLVRQIVDALVYIHAQGVIHRDLKPANIFLDSDGNVKVGDFGLAVERPVDQEEPEWEQQRPGTPQASAAAGDWRGQQQQQQQPPLGEDGRSLSHDCPSRESGLGESREDSLTGGVGTTFYRAPEQEEGHSFKQTYKCDLFALGVVWFELLSEPFSTFMERAETLTALRSRDRTIPPRLEEANPEACEMIRSLMQHDPNARPTAQGLLSLLPSKIEVETEYLQEAVSIVCDPRSQSFDPLMTSLFAQPPRNANVEFLYDFGHDAFSDRRAREAPSQQQVAAAFREVFERHCAVAFAPPLLRPKFTAVDGDASSGESPELMDRSGVVVTLPQDLTTPFARHASHTGLTRFKAYQIGHVFTRNPHGGHPGDRLEACMSTVDNRTGAAPILVSEAILSGFQCLGKLIPAGGDELTLRVTHAKFVHLFLELAGLTAARPDRSRGLEKLIAKHWAASGLTGLPSPASLETEFGLTVAEVKLFTELSAALPGDPLEAIERLHWMLEHRLDEGQEQDRRRKKSHRRQAQRRAALDALDGVRQVLTYLETRGPRKTRLDFGFEDKRNVFREGLLFQILETTSSSRQKHGRRAAGSGGGATVVLCAGGQFDSLLEEFRRPEVQRYSLSVCAVGVRLNLDRLARKAALVPQPSNGPPTGPTGDFQVLLVTFDEDASSEGLAARLGLARRLWEQGIRADYLTPVPRHESSVSIREQLLQHCKDRGFTHMVTVKLHSFREKSLVRLSAVHDQPQQEKSIHASNLVETITEEHAGRQSRRRESEGALEANSTASDAAENGKPGTKAHRVRAGGRDEKHALLTKAFAEILEKEGDKDFSDADVDVVRAAFLEALDHRAERPHAKPGREKKKKKKGPVKGRS